MAYFYYKSGNLWGVVVFHGLWDWFAFGIYYSIPTEYGITVLGYFGFNMVILAGVLVLMLGLFGLCGRLFWEPRFQKMEIADRLPLKGRKDRVRGAWAWSRGEGKYFSILVICCGIVALFGAVIAGGFLIVEEGGDAGSVSDSEGPVTGRLEVQISSPRRISEGSEETQEFTINPVQDPEHLEGLLSLEMWVNVSLRWTDEPDRGPFINQPDRVMAALGNPAGEEQVLEGSSDRYSREGLLMLQFHWAFYPQDTTESTATSLTQWSFTVEVLESGDFNGPLGNSRLEDDGTDFDGVVADVLYTYTYTI
jgi:hypothetical protein